jgi:8-amino-7-oxononanoate synthase
LAGHPHISEEAKKAIDQYGTSVSASRLVSGERPIHQQLEKSIAEMLGVESCLTFVSGHATNVTTIGYLFGKNDLIVYDDLIHNSVVQGALLSGAKRLHFPHNDPQALKKILEVQRGNFEKVLIVTESLFSMDGDIADLPAFIQIKKDYKCFLMVDEAHSIGVLGQRGFGIREHFNVSPNDVDIWMGTLSKTLASSGGYIAGTEALTEQLKYFAPGFVYSVGIAPPLAAASLAALHIMKQEPERVRLLKHKSQLFHDLCQKVGLNTGHSAGYAIIPIIIGDSVSAVRLANALFAQGIYVQPIIYPGVAKSAARLRFFINCMHEDEDIYNTVKKMKIEADKIISSETEKT